MKELNTIISSIIFILLVASCTKNKDIPLNQAKQILPQESKVKSFNFTSPKTIAWEDIKFDNPVKKHFNVNNLSSASFNLNDFKPIGNILEKNKLDWSKIEQRDINLDTFPTLPFETEMYILPEPTITTISLPIVNEETPGVLNEGLTLEGLGVPLEDNNGTLWFSYEKGICKYVGNKLYTYEFGGKETEISDMELDVQGRIWISTYGKGLYIFDIKNGVILRHTDQMNFLRISRDSRGNMWLTSGSRKVYMVKKGFAQVKIINKLTDHSRMNLIYEVFEDSNNNLWLGGRSHVSIIDPDRKKMITIGENAGFESNIVHDFIENKVGQIWFTSFDGKSQSISLKDSTYSVLNSNFRVTSQIEDEQGKLWFIGNDTILITNAAQTQIKRMITDVSAVGFITNRTIITKKGMLYFSHEKGVSSIDTKGLIQDFKTTEDGLWANYIGKIIEDKFHRIWIITAQGINIYDPVSKTIKQVTETDGLESNYINNLINLKDGRILAISNVGYSIFDLNKNTIETYANQRSNYRHIYSGLLDKKGRLWLATDRGVFILNENGKTIKRLSSDVLLASDLCYEILNDYDGNFWIATRRGIGVINESTNSIKYLRKTNGLITDWTRFLSLDKKGNIWVGTNEGVSIITPYTQSIRNINADDGLVSENIRSIICMDNQMLVGTTKGLMLILEEQNDYKIYTYNNSEIYNNLEYSSGGLVTSNNQIWISTGKGLMVANQSPIVNFSNPKVEITSVNILDQTPYFSNDAPLKEYLQPIDEIWNIDKTIKYNKSNLRKDTSYAAKAGIEWDNIISAYNIPEGLKLPHDQNALHISYASSTIKGISDVKYKYSLVGPDVNFLETTGDSKTKIFYNLDPGDYTFKVSMLGFKNQWSEETIFSFIVTPIWWKTWWAYFLYASLVSAIIWYVINYKSKTRYVESEKFDALSAQLSKSNFAVKTFKNKLIYAQEKYSMSDMVIGLTTNTKGPIVDFLNANSSQKKKSINTNALVDQYVKIAYQTFIVKNPNFEAKIIVDFEDTLGEIKVIRQNVGRAVFNLCENAFESMDNTEVPTLWVTTKSLNLPPEIIPISNGTINDNNPATRWAQISIRDNGRGNSSEILLKIFKPFFTSKSDNKGIGLGLSIAHDTITKDHGGDISVTSKIGEGTEFTILLPIG